MADEIKSKTADLVHGLAAAARLATMLCSTPEEVEKYKKLVAFDIAKLINVYPKKEGHRKRLLEVKEIANQLINILHESETHKD